MLKICLINFQTIFQQFIQTISNFHLTLYINFIRVIYNMSEKYNTLVQQEQTTIIDHYKSIIQFKKTEAKVNLLIEAPQTQEQQKAQLLEMKENLQNAIRQQLSTLRQKQKKDDLYPLSIQLLRIDDVGKLTKCYIQEDKKWKNAKVIEVDAQQQQAKIKRYGAGHNQITMPAYFLKVLKQPDPILFQEGTHCKAIYSGDGQFYPCVIQKIDEEGYHVKYKKYNSQQAVELHRLRPIQNQNQKAQQVEFNDLTQFKVPDKLKILPNDPQNVKKSKKSKIKALKFSFKNAQIQQVNKQKQQKWKSWNEGGSLKTGHFKSKLDMQVFSKKK